MTTIRVLLGTLRAYQWTKNLLVFAGLIFAQQLGNAIKVERSVFAFIAFCLASSAMYIFNDLLDIKKDREHPEKKNRPLASGAIAPSVAILLMLLLLFTALGIAWELGTGFFVCLVVYFVITTAYTLVLKDAIIIDVLIVAMGFVIRAMAGAIVLNVVFSNWLVVCTLFLALLLSLSKRRHEMECLEDNATSHREVLRHYTVSYLDSMIMIMAAATLITYTIYTCSPEVVQRLGTDKLYLTIPFVVYGLFRYCFLVHNRAEGGDPSKTLLMDWPLGVTVLLWGITCITIIQFKWMK